MFVESPRTTIPLHSQSYNTFVPMCLEKDLDQNLRSRVAQMHPCPLKHVEEKKNHVLATQDHIQWEERGRYKRKQGSWVHLM